MSAPLSHLLANKYARLSEFITSGEKSSQISMISPCIHHQSNHDMIGYISKFIANPMLFCQAPHQHVFASFKMVSRKFDHPQGSSF